MIKIQTNNGNLDLYTDTQVSIEETAFRFQEKIREPYSNNFDIPKNNNNLRILEATGLLYSRTQLLGNRLSPAILHYGSSMMPIYLQVVCIKRNDIEICVYEDIHLYQFKDKSLHELGLLDNHSTIYRWNLYSHIEYPSVFKWYNYGCDYSPLYAQLHPSLPLNTVLNNVFSRENMTIDSFPSSWRLLATKKKVCPQNITQVLEYTNYGDKETNGLLTVQGGKHIVNDLSFDGTQKITFNRDCYTSMKIWYGWHQMNLASVPFIYIQVNGQNKKIIDYRNGGYYIGSINAYGIGIEQFSYNFKKGDVLTFYCPAIEDFNQSFSMVVRMQNSSYTITEDDYDIDLDYKGRLPEVKVKFGQNITVYSMNGSTYHTSVGDFATENLSFAYYGYYCNLPDTSIGSLLHSLQWTMGKKISATNNRISFIDPNKSAVIEGYLDEVYPSSTHLGRSNYIRFTGEEYPTAVSTIANEWLAKEKDIHKSLFAYMRDNVVAQYSNPEIEQDSGWTIEFTEVEGVVLFDFDGAEGVQIPLYSLGFEHINKSNEVKILTNTPNYDLKNCDIVYFDGLKYYVITCETDIDTGISTIIGILE